MTREELHVKTGTEYDHYFPRAMGGSETKKKGATVADTIRFIPQVVQETKWQTKRFALEVIKTDDLYTTCKNIWDFVFNHIAYKKDEDGKEQIRSPARSWRDRHNNDDYGNSSGVDCDCYTVFISSILSNLKIKHVLRITKYEEDHFQHIYPIVPLGNGKHITIDCVVKQFNYEEPYTEKKDTTMDLEYLNGTVSDRSQNTNKDTEDLLGTMNEKDALMELGKIFKRRTAEQKQERRAKIKKFLNKGLHITNRFNPATATLRVGVLAAMKLNFMKIGGELKYTYLPDEEARRLGVPMDKFHKMKRVREKLEKLFYGAGGKIENLKKAILKGRGNRNKDVPFNGLDDAPYENVNGLHEDLPISQLLGASMYTSEGMHEINGLGELGEPATAATIAAATTVLTTIVALIKKVGSIIPKKKSGASSEGNSNSDSNQKNGSNEDGSSESSSNENNSSNQGQSNSSNNESSSSENNSSDNETTNGNAKQSVSSNLPANTNSKENDATDEENDTASSQRTANKSASTNTNSSDKISFWEKHKKWIKPTGIVAGSIGLIALAYQLFKPKPKPALKGVPEKNDNTIFKPKSKKNKTVHQPKSKKAISPHKEAVTLL